MAASDYMVGNAAQGASYAAPLVGQTSSISSAPHDSGVSLRLSEDDPALAVAINFWPEKLNKYLLGDDCPPGDERVDYDLGDLFGKEAVWFIRNHFGPALLTAILMWMGERLHRERRCHGPLARLPRPDQGRLPRRRRDGAFPAASGGAELGLVA
jgi:hypothetical protein